jgi:hypothetical protein
LQLGKDLGLPSDQYVDSGSERPRRRPRPLDLAVLAVEAQEALEVLAAREVALARDQDGLTWEQVGDAFGISTQSAHHRFATKAARTQPTSGETESNSGTA